MKVRCGTERSELNRKRHHSLLHDSSNRLLSSSFAGRIGKLGGPVRNRRNCDGKLGPYLPAILTLRNAVPALSAPPPVSIHVIAHAKRSPVRCGCCRRARWNRLRRGRHPCGTRLPRRRRRPHPARVVCILQLRALHPSRSRMPCLRVRLRGGAARRLTVDRHPRAKRR